MNKDLIKTLEDWSKFLTKIKSAPEQNLDLINHAMVRQARTVNLIIQAYLKGRPGLILADDVGLGKTWVGILLAIAIASAGGRVVISAPNKMVRNNWAKQFENWYGDNPHPNLWEKVDNKWKHTHPGEEISYVSFGEDGSRLQSGRIMLITHNQFKGRTTPFKCDLLIVDEAHRGKSSTDQLDSQNKSDFCLFMTATPFGKDIGFFRRMLELIKCNDNALLESISNFKRCSDLFYKTNGGSESEIRDALNRCKNLLPKWLIRHSIDTINEYEREMIGKCKSHNGKNQIEADETTIRRIIHAQRLKEKGEFRYLDAEYKTVSTLMAPVSINALRELVNANNRSNAINTDVLWSTFHWKCLEILTNKNIGIIEPPKQKALYNLAMEQFKCGEKFIVFCYYKKTADEVTEILRKAWEESQVGDVCLDKNMIKNIGNIKKMNRSLDKFKYSNKLTIKPDNQAINQLLDELEQHENVRRKMGDEETEGDLRTVPNLPGSEAVIRTMFNSPFHPQALVLTTEHSEGIDLHRNCRILIHYEMSYRIEQLLQANGRIRRLGSWASKVGKPIEYFYPCLKGTRDEELTNIVIKRADQFSKMLGALPDIDFNDFQIEDPLVDMDVASLVYDNDRFEKTL